MSERIECSWCGEGAMTYHYGVDGNMYGECDRCTRLEIIINDDDQQEPDHAD
jgi:hypothetical protein